MTDNNPVFLSEAEAEESFQRAKTEGLTAKERALATVRLPTRFEIPELVGGGFKWLLRAPMGQEVIAVSPREYVTHEEACGAVLQLVEAFSDITDHAFQAMVPEAKTDNEEKKR